MQLFLVRLKYLLRSKPNLFWTFGFPLLLGTFFYLAFGELSEDSFIETSDLYVVNADDQLVNFLKELASDGTPLFNVHTDRDKETLEAELLDQKITGYIYVEDNTIIYRINDNGLTQTITKSVLDQYLQVSDLFLKIITTDPSKVPLVEDAVKNPIHFLSEPYSKTDANANRLIIYFYALIASQAFYGAFWGLGIANDLQANMSDRAIRISVSPTHKLKLILIHFLAALIIHFVGSLLLLAYLKVVLGISFGDQTLLIIVSQFIGCIGGISLGILIGSLLIGTTINSRESLMSLITTFLSFLAGLMSVQIKFLIDKYVPFVRYINPVGLLTDALYSLYYYEKLTNFFKYLSFMTVLSVLFVAFSYFRLRGTKYDSV